MANSRQRKTSVPSLRIDVNAGHLVWFLGSMTRAKLQELTGEDWRDGYFVERIHCPPIMAVEFWSYMGSWPPTRRFSSSTLLDDERNVVYGLCWDNAVVVVPVTIVLIRL